LKLTNPHKKKFLILVCTYNEISNIALFLPALLTEYESVADVLVIDDSSPDGTADWVTSYAEEHPSVLLLKRAGKLGRGSASKEGYCQFLSSSYEALIEIDADFSHDYRDIRRMMELQPTADMIVGSRLIPGGSYGNYPWRRVVLSNAVNTLFRLSLQIPIRDVVQSFHLINRKVFELIDPKRFKAEGFSIYVELKYWTRARGCTIYEIPIVIQDRTAGYSKLGVIDQCRSVFQTLKSIMKLRKDLHDDSMVEH
jgi:dolichol-phosphate mannosyltransferase